MSKVDDARTAVNAINGALSSPKKFIEAYAKVVEAGKTVEEDERLALQEIAMNLVAKMRDETDFRKLRESANAFVEDIGSEIIGTGMRNIAARNQELSKMLAALDQQNAAINASANKLPQIIENINKATAAVKTAKTLFSQLASADASKTAKLQAVITALEELEKVFKPA